MAGGGGGGGNDNKGDDGKYIIFLLLAVAIGWVLWVALKPQFLWVTFGFNLVQYKLLGLIGLLDGRGARWLSYVSAVHNAAMAPPSTTNQYSPSQITWGSVLAVQEDIGSRMKWLWIVLAASMSILVLFRMRGDGFKQQWSLTGRAKKEVFRFLGMRVDNKMAQLLIRILTLGGQFGSVTRRKEWVTTGGSFAMYQARHWREALTGAIFDPDADEPNMRPSLTPPEWLRERGIKLKNGSLEQADTLRALQLQVGMNWNGLAQAPLHVQAIMIMSALNVKGDNKSLGQLRASLAECYTLRLKNVDVEVTKLLAPFLSNAGIEKNINIQGNKHAFLNTACIAVYGWGGPMEAWGGQGSVLSSSLFLWLKRVDRTLWYALNNVGRRQYHIEGSGAVCHYFVERLHNKLVGEANVDNALEGIIKYLNSYYITDLDKYFEVKPTF